MSTAPGRTAESHGADGDSPAAGGGGDGAADGSAAFDRAAALGMTLAHWADRRPDAPAIVSPHGDRTFAELNGNANGLVRALRQQGVTAGDRPRSRPSCSPTRPSPTPQ